ncbi:glycosyltransferase family 2 protein [Butyrivibrio sp. INlla14]|uniref:glycosyltransferase family 2 protein n=1 Tax=Butyrivibrio sp. INlla14 TaxID=1520808 RepID=UPI000876DC82|nr:glycosyltransferase family 2 protein [Butyrivibrio sp. INlla14]SCY34085.1 Glycosyltransferase involved in cell wall bisynthesis [Butyrivibrio sp. INlla14]
MKKVSVVIPAYNAHDTLARCLGSLVNQTLQDMEVVVVNDASKDDTIDICNRCKAAFPDRVVVVDSKENLGCGGARSLGLDAASGEFIGMADADDYVAPTMYEKLYEKAIETGADIVDSGFYAEATDTALLKVSDDLAGDLDDIKRSRLIVSGGYLVTKIFRREIFEEPKVRMQRNMAALEDLEIFTYSFLRARRIAAVKEIFYNYCDTAGSNTKMMDLDKYYDAVYRAMQGTYDKCHDRPEYPGCQMAIEFMMANVYSYAVNRCLYNQIARLGADKRNVKRYFEGLPSKELSMIKELVALRNEVIKIPFEENDFIMSKIAELDLAILKECEMRFGA